MRLPVYVLGLSGMVVTACAEAPKSGSRASDESSFAALLRAGRTLPGATTSERAAYADVRFPGATARLEADRDGLVTWATFDTRKMPTVAIESLERDAREFVDAHATALGVGAGELAVDERGVVLAESEAGLAFVRNIDGRAVEGAFLQMIYARDGAAFRLAELVNRTYGHAPGLRSNVGDAEPDWETVVGFRPEVLKRTDVLYPTSSDNARTGVALIQAVRVELASPAGERYTVVYDPESGRLLQAVDHKQAARIMGEVYDRSYFYADRKITTALAGATINGREAGDDGATTESGTVRVTLTSSVVRVLDRGRTVSFQIDADGDAVAREGDVDLAALNTFVAINRVVAFAAKRLDTSRISYFNQPVDVTVNASGSCNAFYNGDITLFAAGGSCGNMGLVNDVIYHEWGHGLDAFTGTRGGITDSAFSEGIGDIVSGFLTGDPNMGPGFRTGREQGIRSAKNKARFPNDRGEAHREGTIVAGAFWDMREALMARYGAEAGKAKAETIFLRHLLTTDSYQQSYQGALRINDDDANPATRSPDHCLITVAFAAHGLAREEADCRDDAGEPTLPSKDSSLHVLVVADDASGFELAAAVAGDKTVTLCLADARTCTASGTKHDLGYVAAKGDVRIYKSAGKIALATDTPFTLLAKDRTGAVTGYATMRLERP